MFTGLSGRDPWFQSRESRQPLNFLSPHVILKGG